MAVNCWATDRLGVRIVGLCHSVQGTSELLARELGVPYDEVTFDCAGVNHTAWFTTFRRGHEDLIPKIREVMKARHVDGTIPMLPRSDDPYESNERVRAELMMLTGYFHTESSHHASEYWAWFRKTPELVREYLDREWNYLEVCRSVDAKDSNEEILEEARREGIRHGGEFAAPIMDSVVTGTPRVVYGNVRNGGAIDNLPADACVEVACAVDANGVHPVPYGSLPPACAALNQVQINVQRLTVEAAMTGDRDLVHAAVALDPLTSAVQTLPKIREMVDPSAPTTRHSLWNTAPTHVGAEQLERCRGGSFAGTRSSTSTSTSTNQRSDPTSPASGMPGRATFAALGVSRPVIDALKMRGIDDPFAIQTLVIADAIAGRDVLAKSRTGSGKTLAFAVPIVERTHPDTRSPTALILAPTRELASQVAEDFRAIADVKRLKIATVYGGVGIQAQAKPARHADIVIATPGRLLDLVQRKLLRLDRVRIAVLDEADRMLDMGFLPDVTRILQLVRVERPDHALLRHAGRRGRAARRAIHSGARTT